MNNKNASLATFSTFINWMLIGGSVGLISALFLFAATAADPLGAALPGILGFLSANALSLGVIGAFLRQTARVVVEGLDGNLFETDSYAANITFSSDDRVDSLKFDEQVAEPVKPRAPVTKETIQAIRVGWLTPKERVRFEAMGEPDISGWDGTVQFDTWLVQEKYK